MADTVRLTVQMRDPDNNVRMSVSCTVATDRAPERARQLAARMGRSFDAETWEESGSKTAR